MKKTSPLRALLGISQDDMAQLLGLSRSQVSMFESGKRDLPREAKILVAPMLAHATKATLKREAEETQPNPKQHQCLKQLLQENELQRMSIARKLYNTKELHQKNLAVLSLTSFLTKSNGHRTERFNLVVQSIKSRAHQALATCDETVQLKYEIKTELLELEKLLLEEHLTKHTNAKALKK
jgi:transcriptional regulator with XRE-family HTH domain